MPRETAAPPPATPPEAASAYLDLGTASRLTEGIVGQVLEPPDTEGREPLARPRPRRR